MKVLDKVFVVTGGGSGLGREMVLELLRRGANVAAVDINEITLNETKELSSEFEGKLSTHKVDITNKDMVANLPEKILSIHGSIDGLINNAGIIQPFIPVNEMDFETINKVMQVNFFGALYMVKAFLPVLLKRPEAHLVNVSSMGGFFPFPGQTLYGASKAALKLLTEGLYTELLNTNVNVTLVLPGSMGTNIMKNSGVKMNSGMEKMQNKVKVLSADKAAQIIIDGIEKNKVRILVGTDAKFMDILYRLFPKTAPRIFSKLIGSKLIGK
jgi:short-subunit dehydrogenase